MRPVKNSHRYWASQVEDPRCCLYTIFKFFKNESWSVLCVKCSPKWIFFNNQARLSCAHHSVLEQIFKKAQFLMSHQNKVCSFEVLAIPQPLLGYLQFSEVLRTKPVSRVLLSFVPLPPTAFTSREGIAHTSKDRTGSWNKAPGVPDP